MGTTQPRTPESQIPETPSVNWYGGEMPTHGNASRVTAIPKFEGLRKWRRLPPTGAWKTNFEHVATADAKTIGIMRALG